MAKIGFRIRACITQGNHKLKGSFLIKHTPGVQTMGNNSSKAVGRDDQPASIQTSQCYPAY